MTFGRAIGISGVIGASFPILFLVADSFIALFRSPLVVTRVDQAAFYIKLMFWPTSLPFMAAAANLGFTSGQFWLLFLLALLLNVLIYIGLGVVLWIAAEKLRVVFMIPALVIGVYWIVVFRL